MSDHRRDSGTQGDDIDPYCISAYMFQRSEQLETLERALSHYQAVCDREIANGGQLAVSARILKPFSISFQNATTRLDPHHRGDLLEDLVGRDGSHWPVSGRVLRHMRRASQKSISE